MTLALVSSRPRKFKRSNVWPVPPVDTYFLPYSQASNASANAVANLLRVSPYICREDMVIDTCQVDVMTAGGTGSILRIGVYESDDGGLPYALMNEAGSVSLELTNFPVLSVDWHFKHDNIYWLGFVAQNATVTPALRSATGAEFGDIKFAGNETELTLSANFQSYSMDNVSDALPSTFNIIGCEPRNVRPRLHRSA